jgi:hypothetical protein
MRKTGEDVCKKLNLTVLRKGAMGWTNLGVRLVV